MWLISNSSPFSYYSVLVVYFLSKNLDEFKDKYFLLACFFGGLSVSTKYNGYMIFLTLGLFILYIRRVNLRDARLYIKSALVSFLGFFIGTPYFVFDYQTFLISDNPKGALWQFNNVGKVEIVQQISNFYNNLFTNYIDEMGYLPITISIIFIMIASIMFLS
jgi:hypothetical protein